MGDTASRRRGSGKWTLWGTEGQAGSPVDGNPRPAHLPRPRREEGSYRKRRGWEQAPPPAKSTQPILTSDFPLGHLARQENGNYDF